MPISYDRWQSYPWKNELDMQNKRVIQHYDNERSIPNGLLIASDWHMKTRLLHLPVEEFGVIVQLILDDKILTMKDSWDPEKGTVHAVRK